MNSIMCAARDVTCQVWEAFFTAIARSRAIAVECVKIA